MLEGFKKVAEGLSQIVEPLNPLVTDMTPRNKEIATGLLASGFSVKEIQDFVDVSRVQLDEHLVSEDHYIKRKAEDELKTKAASAVKAKAKA